MTQEQIKINSRVTVVSSAIPNATSFIGLSGTVMWTTARTVGVALDKYPDEDPLMFFKREVRLDS